MNLAAQFTNNQKKIHKSVSIKIFTFLAKITAKNYL
jgi:hypothetical protein